MKPSLPLLKISKAEEAQLVLAARDSQPVNGLTHNFYRYPARFSPTFVRAAIEAFSKPGDLVLDPFMGGGTSLVEALALGRHAVGADISSLATFVSSVKTTIFKKEELERLSSWAENLLTAINVHRHASRSEEYAGAGYYKHLDHSSRWRLRKAIEQAISSAVLLRSDRLELFARCVVLRTAQWALDGRKKLPSISEFRAELIQNAKEMILGAHGLCAAIQDYDQSTHVHCLNRSAVGLEKERLFKLVGTPRLIVTSPPYPGIHILYHRWQVDGRKETPAPFWIANKLDGAGSSYYTMGDRKYPELRTYFDNLRAIMSSIATLSNKDTTIVQMVAFAEPAWQLPRYLEVVEESGFSEAFLPSIYGHGDGRLWRSVPGRRWYSDQRGETPGSQEVVLIHRRAEDRDAIRRRARAERLSAVSPVGLNIAGQ